MTDHFVEPTTLESKTWFGKVRVRRLITMEMEEGRRESPEKMRDAG